ncbi:hypothetical protein [Variovorax sp. V118]|uniref:hypothetical protein n=1 Tax=Variovorax sp. V118 TaxID=3065954 RepID=UPI0034E877FE
MSVLDPALQRRAAIVEEFTRPDDGERQALLAMDLEGVGLTDREIKELVAATGPRNKLPGWTFSDIRTRLYPAALAQAFPDRALTHQDLIGVASAMRPSPVMEDK